MMKRQIIALTVEVAVVGCPPRNQRCHCALRRGLCERAVYLVVKVVKERRDPLLPPLPLPLDRREYCVLKQAVDLNQAAAGVVMMAFDECYASTAVAVRVRRLIQQKRQEAVSSPSLLALAADPAGSHRVWMSQIVNKKVLKEVHQFRRVHARARRHLHPCSHHHDRCVKARHYLKEPVENAGQRIA
jgi:hypothetical protein